MATQKTNRNQAGESAEKNDMASWRPGSEAERAKDVGAAQDFGVPNGAVPTADREYVSENTKRSDPGNATPFAWEQDGVRDHGAGGRASGPGSASGGDLDPDLIGFGTGGGVAANGPTDAPGPDDSDGSSNEFASPVPRIDPAQVVIEPAQGRNQQNVGHVGGSPWIDGSVAQDPDAQTLGSGQGADAATNAARDDDSFAGEVSSGEASGQDLPISAAEHEARAE